MKRLLLFTGLVLALGLGLASAQNITKSLQGSQDPRGPVGQDTSNAMYFPGHINAFGQFTTVPTPSAATTGVSCVGSATGGTLANVLASGSTDVAQQVTTRNTSCAIIFGSPFNAAPICVATPTTYTISAALAPSQAIATATTGFTMTNLISGAIYNIICIGNQ